MPRELGHPGALDERTRIVPRLGRHRLRGDDAVAWSLPLPPMPHVVTVDQVDGVAQRSERRAVELDAVDRGLVRTPPVQVHPAVVVLEQVRIPERERPGQLLEDPRQGIGRAPERARLVVLRRREHQRTVDLHAHLAHSRGSGDPGSGRTATTRDRRSARTRRSSTRRGSSGRDTGSATGRRPRARPSTGNPCTCWYE